MKKYCILTVMSAAVMTVSAITVAQPHRHTPHTQTETSMQHGDTVKAATATDAKAAEDADAAAKKHGVSTSRSAYKPGKDKSLRGGAPTKGAYGNSADDTEDGAGEGIEAYSDTTDTCESDSMEEHSSRSYQVSIDEDGIGNMFSELTRISSGVLGTLLILLIIFVFSPVAILLVIFYFIYRNRKEKLRLAEMAMKNGQPLPEQLVKRPGITDDEMWRKGIKHIFLGIGLMFLFGFMDFDNCIGIGFLVLFYGAGQAVIARTSASRRNKDNTSDGGTEGERQ